MSESAGRANHGHRPFCAAKRRSGHWPEVNVGMAKGSYECMVGQ